MKVIKNRLHKLVYIFSRFEPQDSKDLFTLIMMLFLLAIANLLTSTPGISRCIGFLFLFFSGFDFLPFGLLTIARPQLQQAAHAFEQTQQQQIISKTMPTITPKITATIIPMLQKCD